MFQKKTAHIIVLHRFPYRDNRYLVEALTPTEGKTAFSVQRTRTNKALFAKLQPARLLEVEYTDSPRFHPRIHRAVYMPVYRSVPFDMRKTAVAALMAEILRQTVRGGDPELYLTARNAFIELDTAPYHPDFHLHFLQNITRKLGIFPEENKKGIIFASLPDGTSRTEMEKILHRFLQTGTTRNYRERQLLTGAWLAYLQSQIENFRIPHSYRIFSQILGS